MGNESSHPENHGEPLENNVVVNWKSIAPQSTAAREGHCCAALGTRLYVFGGVCAAEHFPQEVNDFFCFDNGLFVI